jgi:hypothetical protein
MEGDNLNDSRDLSIAYTQALYSNPGVDTPEAPEELVLQRLRDADDNDLSGLVGAFFRSGQSYKLEAWLDALSEMGLLDE